jgi:hypothetical protein
MRASSFCPSEDQHQASFVCLCPSLLPLDAYKQHLIGRMLPSQKAFEDMTRIKGETNDGTTDI